VLYTRPPPFTLEKRKLMLTDGRAVFLVRRPTATTLMKVFRNLKLITAALAVVTLIGMAGFTTSKVGRGSMAST
jgi:hypothetical protein